ncbi:AraC-like regulator [Pochonia chlamydosporia 170]|uniref:AraC-like regulator n=1 Tax=Pochonia chlamydosporia 170 TaxID=1380566 RepID=A0A179FWC1_METCM|nr:AraC-like regulator [Pochonia chlamydosporia 170]OAQ69667.1 AraC-like regulator [Pochonia chlamydosporia 170]
MRSIRDTFSLLPRSSPRFPVLDLDPRSLLTPYQQGKVRFHIPGRPSVDVAAGEMVTVPVRLPHKFSNPFDEEAVFINTATPGFFVRYFEHLENLIGDGKVLTPEINAEALKRFATIPLPPEDVKRLEETGMAGEKKLKAENEIKECVNRSPLTL